MIEQINNLMDANTFQNMNVGGQPQTIPYQQANVYSNSASAIQGQGNIYYIRLLNCFLLEKQNNNKIP